ncbi:hypothetical protein AB0G32_07165 [Streptomyces sp. NPDC023723]|uniref:hypothetical protein n=1 Tax=Streptomyces sp. NPDC023723 TaxID=3154323 RepID=UPI0033D0DE4C
MSLWSGRRARRRAGRAAPEHRDGSAPAAGEPAGPRVLVEDHDGLLLLRLPTDDTLLAADVTDLARALRAAGPDTVTIVAAAGADASAALWSRLSESLDSLREAGTRSVRLVLSGAGLDRPDRPAPARRIADAWGLTVEAPDGPVLVVPGGSVFVPPGDGGWWRFAPGERPEPLGPRTPAPHWQAALRGAPERTSDGCVVEQIPAGLLIRPAEATAARPGDLFHAVPVDPKRPAVIVGVPWGEDVLASEVAEVLAALPAAVRSGVRLAPGGRRDLLPLGRAVATELKAEVEVATGVPLFAADSPLGTYGVRSVLVGPDGAPRWLPFVDAVLCLPPAPARPAPGPDGLTAAVPGPAPAPRLLRWTSPLPDPRGPEDGVLLLSDTWRATVTRAGLWVDRRDGPPPPWSARPVSSEGPTVELGLSGDRLDDSLWPVLSRLLGRLPADLRTRTTLHVHATPPDGGLALRTLAADHALRVIRFTTAPAGRPGTRGGAAAEAGGTGSGAAAEAGGTGSGGAGGTRGPGALRTEGAPVGPAAPAAPAARGTGDAPPPPVATRSTAPAPAPRPAPVSGVSVGTAVSGSAGPVATASAASAPAAPVTGTARNAPRLPAIPRSRSASGAPAAPTTPEPSADPASEAAAGHPLPAVPVSPRHRSTAPERAAFRALAGARFEQHGAARADLIAIRLYLQDDDGPLGHRALTESLRSGAERLLPYAGCLASGLARLPAYRGAVLRGHGDAAGLDALRPGQVLRDPAPLSGLPLGPGRTEPLAGVGFAIWSITGRRVGQLPDAPDEVVFAPGTAFKVLGVRAAGAAGPLVLLRQLPDVPTAPTVLEDADETALARLDHALADRASPGTGAWPDRCAGPVGAP